MKTKLESRLEELKEQHQKGQERLMALDQEVTSLRDTILHIMGAIQVLEEILKNEDSELISNEIKLTRAEKTINSN